ncbi:bifunctional diguanylate cyclase/phosphodiesterase [Metabacillus iocasae]|uniref:Diguanylate cyclase (GGDEF)-like protein/PAS domain S-box-containing protein n=1 Tax=Priestia iocasae TaxID=2291674 RepID=A0ABS2QZ67_9BACI|nr:bifunctional diguanylate cyclase/phosphodiesterase [Metabacillus iocasae]MBM7704543.1 diguanylate cyclase (GGDEF)-like protein/PAS domain S-box-containing protein [Metabacillus iocasae]
MVCFVPLLEVKRGLFIVEEMSGHYNMGFVALSIIVAVIASFASLQMVDRLNHSTGINRWKWILAGGLTLGGGIWSMHFVAMLAYDMHMPVTYDAFLLTVSILSSAGSSFLAFYLISKRLDQTFYLFIGSLFIGVGIVSMHYVGMEAMVMSAEISYNMFLVFVSVLIAFVASFVALLVFREFLNHPERWVRYRWGAALMLGAAICGMHYTGMASATFTHIHVSSIEPSMAIDATTLGFAVTFGILLMIGILILLVKYDTKMENHSEQISFMDSMYQSIIETANDAVITIDHYGNIISWNQAAERIFGYSFDEVRGESVEKIMPQQFRKAHVEGVKRFKKTGEKKVIGKTVELEGLHKSGEKFPLELSLSTTSKGEKAYFTGIIRDISERINHQRRIEELVYKDELTHLPNRRMLNEHLASVLSQSEENGEEIALLFIDLDRFKLVNDVYGHRTGDAVLKEVTARLLSCIGPKDLVARQSGDEFVIVLTQTSSNQAGLVASNIIDLMKESMVLDDMEFFISPSIGISLYPADAQSVEDLIKYADTAMYQAKLKGGNQYQFFTLEINELISRKMILETGLRKAASNGEIHIYYQPQVDIETGGVNGFEALVRWNHPELGIISPLEFIPLAEETKLIIPLGEWILRQACLQFKEWLNQGLDLKHISVNISAVQFNEPTFIRTVKKIIEETKIDPTYLDLELTESVVRNPDISIPFMHELKAMGVRLSLDDFGTGYSSLNYLKEFPLDTLKIDKSFIQTIHDSPKDQAVVDTIIHMALNLNLNVIAEGVETDAQLAYLMSRQCHQYQGYLCSAPVPHDQVLHTFFKEEQGVLTGREG